MQGQVTNKALLLKQLNNHNMEIKAFGFKSLGLFGSFVRGNANIDSDVDLLVDFIPGQKNFDNFIGLSFYLEELLGRKVELLTPQSLPKYIGPHILKQVENVFI